MKSSRLILIFLLLIIDRNLLGVKFQTNIEAIQKTTNTTKNHKISRGNYTKIKGFVSDNKQTKVEEAIISYRINNKTYKTKSDHNGDFSLEVPMGIALITIYKTGYKPLSKIDKLSDDSANRTAHIALERETHVIEGLVVGGNKTISNARVNIFYEDGHFLTSTLTNDAGYFQITNVPDYESVYIEVPSEQYKSYLSPSFLLQSDRNNVVITLEELDNKLIFQVFSGGVPLKNKPIKINDNEYETDYNGIIAIHSSKKENIIRYNSARKSITSNPDQIVYQVYF